MKECKASEQVTSGTNSRLKCLKLTFERVHRYPQVPREVVLTRSPEPCKTRCDAAELSKSLHADAIEKRPVASSVGVYVTRRADLADNVALNG